MRIVGGEVRSRALKAPGGTDTRPTLDQIREALFNILQFSISDTRILDLYAGSGALALEALSRGARMAVLVDSSREACRVIDTNIKSLRYEQRACLMPMEDQRALRLLHQSGDKFDLIFLDPPYRMDTSGVMAQILDLDLLAEGGQIIVEHQAATPPSRPDPRLECTDRRRYRDTGISFFGRKTNGGDALPVSGEL